MNVQKFIKTSCGKSKYLDLSQKQGFLARIRFTWFILFAIIRDWRLTDQAYSEKSES